MVERFTGLLQVILSRCPRIELDQFSGDKSGRAEGRC